MKTVHVSYIDSWIFGLENWIQSESNSVILLSLGVAATIAILIATFYTR
ncbi:MAG: hypothetical protein WCY93_07845 [Anaerolineaceae bacterium]